jgi:CRAL/TRIO domain
MLLMMLDARYSMLDEDGKYAVDDVLIIDLKGYTFKHFLNAARNSKTIFLYFKYSQETVPIPTRSCHILNSSTVVNSFMSLIRPMLRKEVAESFQFHSDNLENLHKSVPKEVLPQEYGGEIPMDNLHHEWMTIFESKR